MFVDVVQRLVQVIDHFDSQDQRQKLGVEVVRAGRANRRVAHQDLQRAGVAAQLDPGPSQVLGDFGQQVRGYVAVDEQCVQRVAYRGPLHF